MAHTETITYSYGSYKHLDYKVAETKHEISWEDIPDLDAKTVKAFDEKMKARIKKDIAAEKKAVASISAALKDINAKIDAAMKKAKQGGLSRAEVDEFQALLDATNESIKRREQNRPDLWDKLVKKHAQEVLKAISKDIASGVKWQKWKTAAKCIGFAVLIIAAAVISAIAVIATGGLALIPMAIVVVGSLTKLNAIRTKVKGFIQSDSTTEASLKKAQKSYLSALAELRAVHERRLEMLSQTAAELAMIDGAVAKSRREAKALQKSAEGLAPDQVDKGVKNVKKLVGEFEANAEKYKKTRAAIDADLKATKAKLEAAIALTNNDAVTDAAIAAAKDSDKWKGRVGEALDLTDLLLGGADAMSVALKA